MLAPLVRTSVCAKPGKSFGAISVGGFGGSSGKDMGFAATVCVACASLGFVAVPIKAAANESLSISRRFMVPLYGQTLLVRKVIKIKPYIFVLNFNDFRIYRVNEEFGSSANFSVQ